MCTDERCRHPYTCDCDECGGPARPRYPDIREELGIEVERRTHERTLQTLKLALGYALIYLIGVALLVLLVGCHSPTGATDVPATERQQYIYDYTQCLGAWTGLGYIRVTFHDPLGDGNAGEAAIGQRWVRYDVASVENGADWYLEALASHEVAHLTGANEKEAAYLEGIWPQECGC